MDFIINENDLDIIEKDPFKIEKNDFLLLENTICQVIDFIFPKKGKIGIPKLVIDSKDIYFGKKLNFLHKLHLPLKIPVYKTFKCQVINIEDGFIHLINLNDENQLIIDLSKNFILNDIQLSFNNDPDLIVTVFSFRNTFTVLN